MICLFTIFLLIFFAGWLILTVSRSKYGPRTTQDEIHFTYASDGWRLALHHYRPRGASPHGEPVLLHHGLASNHFTFDLGVGTEDSPVPSIAHWLADRGYDVWVCDLRGRDDSDRPGFFTGVKHTENGFSVQVTKVRGTSTIGVDSLCTEWYTA
jgi:alpha-beta hydrolase superfamily lysophospholipase